MTATDVWDSVSVDVDRIPRDQWDKPVLVPAKGGAPKHYYRPSKLGDNLDNRWNLEQWFKRMTATGLMLRPDLLSLVAAEQGNDKKLNKICDQAIEAAKGKVGANQGVALHKLLERRLRGEDLSHIPPGLQADVDACLRCLERHSFEVVEIEQFVVCEAMEAAGTRDLLLRHHGRLFTGDWKSGAGQVRFGLGGIAVQLSIYSHAETSWDPETKTHTELEPCDITRAYAFHIPSGSGQCDLVEVDIVAGWEAAKTAIWIKQWQKRRDLGRSVTDAADNLTFERELIATRVRALPQGAVDFLARKVADHGGLPRVSQSASAHLDVWADLLVEVEAEFDMPFQPSTTTNRKRNR